MVLFLLVLFAIGDLITISFYNFKIDYEQMLTSQTYRLWQDQCEIIEVQVLNCNFNNILILPKILGDLIFVWIPE